ncbi:XdhC family protein [Streptomyces sp. NBC_01320]|uniref:XdhC family protein n=1 Tax=Streptomyces sp. NBC_01320 TaxID=2903824 RepID=UPI002E10D9E5
MSTSGSAPRPAGTAMAVDAVGKAVGSVSGGCVEGAVYELCQEAPAGRGPSLEHFKYTEDDAFAVGLTCGGASTCLCSASYPTSSRRSRRPWQRRSPASPSPSPRWSPAPPTCSDGPCWYGRAGKHRALWTAEASTAGPHTRRAPCWARALRASSTICAATRP